MEEAGRGGTRRLGGAGMRDGIRRLRDGAGGSAAEGSGGGIMDVGAIVIGRGRGLGVRIGGRTGGDVVLVIVVILVGARRLLGDVVAVAVGVGVRFPRGQGTGVWVVEGVVVLEFMVLRLGELLALYQYNANLSILVLRVSRLLCSVISWSRVHRPNRIEACLYSIYVLDYFSQRCLSLSVTVTPYDQSNRHVSPMPAALVSPVLSLPSNFDT